MRAGGFEFSLMDGGLRTIRVKGTEIVRMLSCPIRDSDWATLAEEDTRESRTGEADNLVWRRSFTVGDGALAVTLVFRADKDGIKATFNAVAHRDILLNRAGFALLHPLHGVTGQPMTIIHPDGRRTATQFPELIAPDQPARDIAGIDHVIGEAAVALRFTGEVFEMEDQRNWTDASFKTYCRPLSAPRPFTVAAGERIRQSVTISCSRAKSRPLEATAAKPASGARPKVALAAERRWWREGDAKILAESGAQALQARIAVAEDHGWLGDAISAARGVGMDVTLEVILDDDTETLGALAETLAKAGITPDRVIALPRAYMASYQPEGPWPEGLTPAEAAIAVRAVFPKAETGVGMLTYFPELNRCPPEPGLGDFVTFGTSAIVHAADDLSVRQTLEALPDVLATARAIAGARPVRLGLVAIGMRTNPYGVATVVNPDRKRIAMAEDDPRQATDFAAEFAIAAHATAARAGMAEIALGMPSGPFGIWHDGHPRPIAAALARRASEAAT